MTHNINTEKDRLRMRENVGAIASHLVERGVITVIRDITQPSDLYSQQNTVLLANRGPIEVVVKLYPWSAQDCWEREAVSLVVYSRHQMPVARILDRGFIKIPSCDSYYYSLLSVVPGISLDSAIGCEPSSSLLRSVATDVVELLQRQESIERFPTATDYPMVAPNKFVQMNWGRVRSRYQAVLAEAGLPSSFFSRVDELVVSINGPNDFGWVTFDWRLRHLFWDSGRISGLLDLESAKASDSLIELSNFVHDVLLNGPGWAKRELAELLYSLYFKSYHQSAEQSSKRFRYYLIRQAIAHPAVKLLQGIEDERIIRELSYASIYLESESPSAIFACF